jgi:hypothetical protein
MLSEKEALKIFPASQNSIDHSTGWNNMRSYDKEGIEQSVSMCRIWGVTSRLKSGKVGHRNKEMYFVLFLVARILYVAKYSATETYCCRINVPEFIKKCALL